MSASQRPGRQVLLLALFLVGVGVVMVYSSSSVLARARFADSAFFLDRQLVRALFGIAIMFAMSRVPLRWLQYAARPMFIASVCFLVLVLIMGEGRSAGRWLPFPVPSTMSNLWFQPSEFAKLALVLYLADVMVRHRDRMMEWWNGVVPRLLVIGAVQLLIVLQPDLGTAVAVGLISLAMLWLGGVGSLHLAAVVLVAIPVAALSVYSTPYQLERVSSFLQGTDPLGAGFQVTQSLLALGSGGVFGLGLGNSLQKYFLPEPHTDFVFALIGEEFGLAGSLSIIGLFASFGIHGYRIARKADTHFGFLVAAGMTVMVSTYALLNIGVVTGLFPTTGLPLPFLSYGGSSLFWNLCGVGILAGVARTGQKAAEKQARGEGAVGLGPPRYRVSAA